MAKGKDVYFAFLDLEKAYDRVDRWLMMDGLVRGVNARVFGKGVKLLDGNENE